MSSVSRKTLEDANIKLNCVISDIVGTPLGRFSRHLDFAALLAATQAAGPSVVQVRTQDVMPQATRTG